MYRIKHFFKKITPVFIIRGYHYSIAFIGAFICGLPSNSLIVIGVTGTKGKSSTTEFINHIFETAGYKTVLLNSIRIKVGDGSKPNTTRMSMPGRFFIQRLLARGLEQKCEVAILEMTSEGTKQFRHRAIALNALVFTNLAPEHIESHGSFEAYAAAKYEIGRQLVRSSKRPRTMIANADDIASQQFLTLPVENILPYSLESVTPYAADDRGGHFMFDGIEINIHLPGIFSIYNALAAATVAQAFGIKTPIIVQALATFNSILGRAERIEEGQDFTVIVDYAHTPDSLEALYKAYGDMRKICVMGSTGGGRDTWKRPVMGEMADKYCDTIILTNEDPYDEYPQSIIDAIARGIKISTPVVILDRREAIATALKEATLRQAQGDQNVVVLITGKGTDPNIAVAGGKKLPWSDAAVAREEIKKLLSK